MITAKWNQERDFSPWLGTRNRMKCRLWVPGGNQAQGRTYKPPPLLSDKLQASPGWLSLREDHWTLTRFCGLDLKRENAGWMTWITAVCNSFFWWQGLELRVLELLTWGRKKHDTTLLALTSAGGKGTGTMRLSAFLICSLRPLNAENP